MNPHGPALRSVEFLHADPFGNDASERLVDDLSAGRWARFLVCYFNKDGHAELSPHLARLMGDPRSQGLVTLTCACGFGAVQALWEDAGAPADRLKVFLPAQGEGPDDAKLLHSKMAFVVRDSPNGSVGVLYVGSHNWTGPGLRLKSHKSRRKNVESSLRLEFDWPERSEAGWLRAVRDRAIQVGKNPALEALAQIQSCWTLASCTDLASPRSQDEFESWMETFCASRRQSPGSTAVIVAPSVSAAPIRSAPPRGRQDPPRPGPVPVPAAGDTLYLQQHVFADEPEVFDTSVTWAVFVWSCHEDLRSRAQPWLLLCRAANLGQEGAGDPGLRRVDWLLYDPPQNSQEGDPDSRSGTSLAPQCLPTRTQQGERLEVEFWSLARVGEGLSSRDLDRRPPTRHALLEVIAVREPESRHSEGRPWTGRELPLHRNTRRARRSTFVVHDSEGHPSPARAEAMRREQEEGLGVSSRSRRLPSGPVGDGALHGLDLFECDAPFNELLFRDGDGRRVAERTRPASRRVGRLVEFEIAPAQWTRHGGEPRVPRLEKLYAPGRAHIEEALGLEESEKRLLHRR